MNGINSEPAFEIFKIKIKLGLLKRGSRNLRDPNASYDFVKKHELLNHSNRRFTASTDFLKQRDSLKLN